MFPNSKISTLSKKQQNKTLSAKKKPLTTIKHALTSKFNTWPIIKEDDKTYLINELKSIVQVEIEKSSVNKKENSKHPNLYLKKHLSNHFQFGINEAAKCIKENSCSSILLESDIPPILVMHIISGALAKEIIVLCIPGLRDYLKLYFGFKSSVLCIKKNASEGSCDDFHKIIEKAYSNIDIKNNIHILHNYSQLIKQDDTPYFGKLDSEPNKVTLLYRNSKKERVFDVPSSQNSKNEEMKSDSSTTENIKLLNVGYQPLVISKFQNNVNRPKKVKKT